MSKSKANNEVNKPFKSKEFLDDDSDSSNDDEAPKRKAKVQQKPAAKKAKITKKEESDKEEEEEEKEKENEDEDEEEEKEEEEDVKKKKPAAKQNNNKTKHQANGNNANADNGGMYQISHDRFVNVSEFKSKILINIREYYQNGGKQLPGKKGISLNLEQWDKLKSFIANIDSDIKKYRK